MAQTHTAGDVRRLVDDLVRRVGAVDRAVLLSRDGLVVTGSSGMEREDAEHLAALVAGVQGLARGACRHFEGGELMQTVIEMDSVFLFVLPVGEDACLAALADADADAGVVAFEMTELAERLGDRMPVEPRLPGRGSGVG
ncbi:roadblock/LC7 domain-containing protein [Actinoallomurus sp. NPDC050550]|uniref:roadblock/LC7 domain-containing protein n=1 Tax=Actinoallomurus sp. NPDC050550 TaxID=3154937 RepID=UPI0033CEDB9C